MNVTPLQARVLAFIEAYQADRQCSPSFDEMRAGLGIASKSQLHRILTCLEERGHIRRLFGKARAIEVIRDDERARVEAAERQAIRAVRQIYEICRRGSLVAGDLLTIKTIAELAVERATEARAA